MTLRYINDKKNDKIPVYSIDKIIKDYLKEYWNKKKITETLNQSIFSLDFNAIKYNISDPIKYVIENGGKRLRPLFFLTLLKIFGVNSKKYTALAVLLEIIHNGTLIIDDIEDKSDLRRGNPVCHKIYGVDTALNAGNLMYFLPFGILRNSSTNLSDDKLLKIFEVIIEELTALHFGQGIDIYWHKKFPVNLSPEKYFEMCRLKTGSLFRMSSRIACTIAEKRGRMEKAFTRFSEAVGIGFQIIDDVLDLTSDLSKFGKSYGNDIKEGKISLPVIYSLKELPRKNRSKLIEILSLREKNEDDISEARRLITGTSALKKSKKIAEELFNKSWENLKKENYSEENLSDLYKLTGSFINRNY